MAELSERLCLYLTDTLTGDIENFTHFFKRSCTSVLKTESEFQNVFLTRSERMQHLAELFAKQRI